MSCIVYYAWLFLCTPVSLVFRKRNHSWLASFSFFIFSAFTHFSTCSFFRLNLAFLFPLRSEVKIFFHFVFVHSLFFFYFFYFSHLFSITFSWPDGINFFFLLLSLSRLFWKKASKWFLFKTNEFRVLFLFPSTQPLKIKKRRKKKKTYILPSYSLRNKNSV